MKLPAQSLRFKTVLDNPNSMIVDMKQDKLGFFWLINSGNRLQKFDGVKPQTFLNDPGNPNSIATGQVSSLIIDADNIIWVGIYGSGLDRLDPSTNIFTHFRHNAKNAYSLSNDTVNATLEDHSGNLWIGSNHGLDFLDRKTGRFTHYSNSNNDPAGTRYPQVYKIYEDRKGILWICGRSLAKDHISPAALNRFDPTTKKFTPYFQDSAKANNGIPATFIKDIYEDSKENFWIVTDAGLYAMDRNTGKCTRYYPDPFNSNTLSQTPVAKDVVSDIMFVTEDSSGAFWVGMGRHGLNRYDPVTKKSMHFGLLYDFLDVSASKKKDTATGLNIPFAIKGVSSKDGLFWVLGIGGISQLNYQKTTFLFNEISKAALALYLEANGKILWIGTDQGLVRKDLATQKEKLLIFNPKDNKTRGKYIFSIVADEAGNLWLGTGTGLLKFDPVTENYVPYKNDPKNPGSISGNNVFYSFFDHNKNLWAASDSGISRMDRATGQFTNYNVGQIAGNYNSFEVNRITEDPEHNIWLTANWGLYKLDIKTGKFAKYLDDDLRSICVDAEGRVWTGGWQGLYAFNKTKDKFDLFANEDSAVNISGVLNITEDDQKNLWISTTTAIIKINENRTQIKKYTEDNGVQLTQSLWSFSSFKATDGRLFLGNYFGYYSFYPDQLNDNNTSPPFNITSFKLGDKLINSDNDGLLSLPISQTEEIKLRYDQNVFSFDFFSADYTSPAEKKYSYMLENYDNAWHEIGSEHRASFFNIPPGSYIFKVKAISGDGGSAAKSIRIIISPPWWETWWFRILSVIALVVVIYAIIKERSRKLKAENLRLEQKVTERTTQLKKSLQELKATQSQLIHAEKMASLGELTAGIAHEIQNPLNFVNNFSEVNAELIAELKSEIEKGNMEEAKLIAGDIADNELKISQHGKRADSIVKGMLQHSRVSTSFKEPTDINKLADEYLRLAYHGLRAKDKSFNTALHTHFDETISLVNVIPQDISRVLLNLFSNSFYAVQEKMKTGLPGFEPAVIVSTEKIGPNLVLTVEDNGNGISQKMIDKIFQPFFTTKPAGQGTGLGLSLSYDIIKAHGGELTVDSKDGEYAKFCISLPLV
ncbi:sensor histidine kinase [Flavihumibacter fluvii]|uniref:sensor histidine kinase n=1 Tax=Flavihumibacter fluvii TaxID=2838157 RepID=UPI001BDECFB9|nr:two-component regulator propeller domain-containing protein [Flavihumibacter fluvii]ULQ52761.1 ATP-binding protein [Flavihumibacter fluvii]